jgi:aspartyl-tRNA(Asn)/glutamyl-tRNA(Gln) amidotransferase subunit C
MDKETVLNLAKLARIEMGEDEAESLSHEFGAILGYVGEIKKAVSVTPSTEHDKESYSLINVMREDDGAHEPGLFTEKVLAQAPAREGDYFRVKKIL